MPFIQCVQNLSAYALYTVCSKTLLPYALYTLCSKHFHHMPIIQCVQNTYIVFKNISTVCPLHTVQKQFYHMPFVQCVQKQLCRVLFIQCVQKQVRSNENAFNIVSHCFYLFSNP